MADLSGLPGAELIGPGLADAMADRITVPALLVAIAAPRLRDLGLEVPDELPDEGELRLYRLLCEEDPIEAYARYNALLRRLRSFCRALERERSRGG